MSGTDLTVTGPGTVDLGAGGVLTFTPTDWETDQTVTVAADKDDDAADDRATLTLDASGADYGSAPSREVTVTVDDDGTPALEVADVPVMVQEQGPGVEFQVRLKTEPVAPVTVRVSGYAGTDVRVTPSERRFTVDNWEAFQTFSVTAVDDTDAVTDPVVTLMLAPEGSAEYAALTAAEVSVTVQENDTPSLKLSVQELDVAEDGSGSFTVRLNTAPVGDDVEVRVTWGSGSDLTVTGGPGGVDLGAGGVLTFTDTDWNAAQRVTVAAGVDDDAANDMETLTLRASGADYGSAPSAEVAVTVDDDETAALVLSKSALPVVEQEPAVSFTVKLASAPSAPVMVTVTGHAGTDLRVAGTVLTFDAGNWDVAQTVTVAARHDADAAPDPETLTLTPTGAAEYAALAASAVTVTVADDDVPGIRPSVMALDVAEGASAEFEVRLNTKPSGTVEVRVRVVSGTDLTVTGPGTVDLGAGGVLTFTPTDWETDQTVTVAADKDDDAADDRATLTLGASGADYGSAPSREVTVTVDDDETAGLDIEDAPVTVQEQGPGVEFQVRLKTEPVAPVTVRVSGYAGTDVRVTPSERRFTVDNWEAFQTFSVRAVDDTDAVTDPVVTLMLAPEGSAEYAALTAAEVSVTVQENDTPSLKLSVQELDVAEDGSGSFTVRLNTAPVGDDVEVRVTWGSGSDLTVTGGPGGVDLGAGGVLTFTDTDWNAAQRVTVAAGVDDDAANDMETLTLRASGADYGSAPSAEVAVTVDDDETAALVLSKSALPVVEQEPAVSFTVKLASAPTAPVTVTVTGHAGTDLTVAGTVLTFDAGNWDVAQTVTVAARHDADAAPDPETLTLTPAGAAEYAALGASAVTVTVADDDVPGIRPSVTALDVAEGASAEFEVRLNTKPSGDVEVRVRVVSGTDLTVTGPGTVDLGAGGVLTFTPTDWETDQTVTVAADKDDDAADDRATLTLGASGADYGSAPSREVTVTVDDDATAALEVADAPVTVQEQGPGVEFRVRLKTEPVAPVTVRVSGYAGTDVRVTPSERRFTVDNWEAFQTFSVRAVDDTDAVTDPVVTLMLAPEGSAEYAALTAAEVGVTVQENDTPSLKVSVQELDVPEDGSGRFTVRLNTRPSGDVEVRVTGVSGTDLTVTGPGGVDLGAGGVLTFTDTDWNAAQRVTVAAGVDDDAADDMETLTLRASGADYGSAPSAEVAVTVDDDETAALAVTGSPVTVQENAATAVEFTVALATQPLGSVTVRVTGHAGTDVRVSPETATFTTDDWATPQTFEVRAGDDSDSQNETVTLALTPEGSAEYAALAAQEVRVSVQDDDVSGVRLSATALDVAEGGRESYRVKLTAQPTGAVEVRVTGMSGTDLTLLGLIGRSVETLAFTPENWHLDQIVDVVAGTDADAADDVVVLRHRASGADYGSAPVQELTVTVADDDMAGLELSAGSVTVQEQGPAVEFTVRLASAPVSRVSVAVTGHAGTDVQVSPGSLSFSASDWRTPKTLQVTADGDADAVDEAVVTLSLAATGSAEYEVLPASEVAVAVEDDDVPALRLSASAVTVPEGGSASYTLRLTTAPTADVTVQSAIISGYGVTLTDRHGNDRVELVFTPSSWSVGQQLTLTAESDEDAADGAAEVRHWVSSSSPAYPYGLDAIVPVTIDDDETAALEVSKRSLRVPFSDDAGTTFEVSLATPPATGGAAVEALVPKAAAASFTVNPPWLSFTYDDWDSPQTVTVTAALGSAVGDTGVLRLVPRHSPEYAELAPVELAMTVTAAAQAQLAPPVVTGTPSVTGPSADGAYAENERIEARVTFDTPVVVDTTGGAPTLGLGIGGMRRDASYESGSGTAELVFALTVASADAGAGAAKALANGLRRNGATIRGEDGTDAVLGFGSAPGVTGVTVAQEPGGDGQWSPGEAVTVAVTFAEPVVVDTTGGTPSIGVLLGGSVAKRAAYTGGTHTATLTFAYSLADADSAVNSVLVPLNSLALNGGTIRSTGGLDAGLEHTGAGRFNVVSRNPLPVLSVADAQASEGESLTFVVTLEPAANAPVTVAYATADGSATAGSDYAAASGTLSFKAGESEKTVAVTLATDSVPEGSETLTLTLASPSGATIGDNEATGTVTDPAPPALTAELRDVPREHDGSSTFTVEVHFSEAPKLSYRTVRDQLFTVGGGNVTRAQRVTKGSNLAFEVTVTPDGFDDVTLSAAPTSDCAASASVCTRDGRPMHNALGATVPGPAGLSVADASVREGPNATLDFVVTLSRARHAATTVEYATSDGTATAESDYTEKHGTLTFDTGETEKTVLVAVLDDAIDDDGETVILTLSKASTPTRITDDTAIGTIENSDHMPKAWLVRFGRTVGSQVLDALSERFDGPGRSHVTVGGIELRSGTMAEDGINDVQESLTLAGWEDEAEGVGPERTMTLDELVTGTRFHLSSGTPDGGGTAYTAWGRVATSGFEAEVDDVTMDGDVTSALVGFDAEWDRALAGVMLSQSSGEGSYRLNPAMGDDAGTVKSNRSPASTPMRGSRSTRSSRHGRSQAWVQGN